MEKVVEKEPPKLNPQKMTISERRHRNVKVIELQPDPIPNYDAPTQHECLS